MIELNQNIKIILTSIFVLLGYAFFILNPYQILDYIYLPFILLFTMTAVFLFVSIDHIINPMEFFYKVLQYVSIFLGFAILYFILKHILLYTINISFGAVFLFYVVVMAIVYNIFFGNTTIDFGKGDDLFQVIKYFIFYIPCILILMINYFIDDVKQTNKTTYVLGFILILLIILFFIIPMINQYLYIHDGLLLIRNKESLNKSILTLTLKELKENINNGPLYKEEFRSLSEVNLPKWNGSSLPEEHKSDEIQDLITQYKDNPEKLKQYITHEINKSLKNKIYYYFKKHFFYNEKQKQMLSQYTNPILYTYHYGISFGLYLNSNILLDKHRDKALILTLGSRPSLYYDYNTRELVIEIKDKVNNKTFQQTRIYNTSKILFQRWNHIVMNYVNGQFDLFVNNEIVSTQSNVSPYINDTDVLQIGSIENTDIGAISHLRYYDQPLSLYKIKKIYNKINN